jgi:hypothetical protein
MRLLTHMLIMLSCAVTSTMADNIGRDHYSLHPELHAPRTAPLSDHPVCFRKALRTLFFHTERAVMFPFRPP